MNRMKFIDLFAGLGGFHKGFAEHGFNCVFACEIDESLQQLYKANYNITPQGDITKIHARDIPDHDIICAGFPCQPFSLAGKKKGATCPNSGKLIDDVVRIAKYHRPKCVILENVPNILTIANGSFWDYLVNSFSDIGYAIDYRIISPVDVGIPQNRRRIFILAYPFALQPKDIWPIKQTVPMRAFNTLLDSKFEHKPLEEKKYQQLLQWQTLIQQCQLPDKGAFSLIAPEFGATYPPDFSNLTLNQIKQYKGAYGESLSRCKTWSDVLKRLPAYTRKNKSIAAWLLPSIQLSRDFYSHNRSYIKQWHQHLNKENNSWQILEWRGIRNSSDLYSHLIQFRASGIRVLKPEIAPSLVAMTPTQIPVVFSEKRYLSKHEAAKLQYLQGLEFLPDNTTKAFRALGNAVNAKIVALIAQNLQSALVAQSSLSKAH